MYYNGTNRYLFVNGAEIIKFEANDSEIAAKILCLGNVSKDNSVDNVKKTVLCGYVYDFSVYYDVITVITVIILSFILTVFS